MPTAAWTKQPPLIWLVWLALAAGVAACAGGGGGVQITSEPLTQPPVSTPTPVSTAPPAQAVQTPEATEVTPLSLVVWWPEPLAPSGDPNAGAALSRLVDEFEAANPDLRVQIRLKKPRDVGGIMETLRAASAVAPGGVPDLTLLRRDDLLAAAQAGLVQPLAGHISSAMLGNLYTAALELGQVSGQFYGLPYMLDVQHLAYWGDFPSGDFASFENVLERECPFVFPAGAAAGVTPVFLLQYLSAGGSLSDVRVGEVNPDALLAVLRFYEQAVAGGVIDPAVLTYAAFTEYLAALQDGSIPAALVSSTVYLGFGAQEQPLAFAPIPMQGGQPMSIVNGWMWALTTANPHRQEAAARFLDWMLDAEQQSRYSRAVHMLPSLRGALRQAGINAAYSDFVTQLLGSAILPPSEISGSATARAMQNALTAVISGQRTAEEAVQDVAGQPAN